MRASQEFKGTFKNPNVKMQPKIIFCRVGAFRVKTTGTGKRTIKKSVIACIAKLTNQNDSGWHLPWTVGSHAALRGMQAVATTQIEKSEVIATTMIKAQVKC